MKKYPEVKWFKSNLLYTYTLLAQKLREEKKSTEARQYFLKAYRLDPGNETALLWYGISLLDNRQLDEAIRILRMGRRMFPDVKYFRGNLTHAYRKKVKELIKRKDYTAVNSIMKTLRNDLSGNFNEDMDTMKTIAAVYDFTEKFEDSVKFLKRALSRYSGKSELYSLLGSQMNKLHHRMIREKKKDHEAIYKEANIYLRKAMNIYEKKNPNRQIIKNVLFPLKGRVRVGSAWDGGGTHSGFLKYCYDFYHVNKKGSNHRPGTGSKSNNDFFAFGKKVYASDDGTVSHLTDGNPDREINDVRFIEGNNISIKHKNGTVSVYVHLKKNSIRIKKNQRVRKGQVIAELGNSGMSYIPHLHFCYFDKNWKSLNFTFEKLEAQNDSKSILTEQPLQAGWVIFK